MGQGSIADMSGFELGTPELVCRWRLQHRRLPLENRHLRALLAREVSGKPVSQELVAWAKQHLEWTLDQGAAAHPDGTLMLVVDGEGRAAMTVGPFEPLVDTSVVALGRRALVAQREAERTHVAPETLWIAQGDLLHFDPGTYGIVSGTASLVQQLAQTMGIEVVRHDDLVTDLADGRQAYDEVFLVSDEYGVVPAGTACGRHGERFAQGYARLLEQCR